MRKLRLTPELNDFTFALRYHARIEGRTWLRSCTTYRPGHELVYALGSYTDNVASADRVLTSGEKAGALVRGGLAFDLSTQAFLSLEGPLKKRIRYPREHYWQLTPLGKHVLETFI